MRKEDESASESPETLGGLAGYVLGNAVGRQQIFLKRMITGDIEKGVHPFWTNVKLHLLTTPPYSAAFFTAMSFTQPRMEEEKKSLMRATRTGTRIGNKNNGLVTTALNLVLGNMLGGR